MPFARLIETVERAGCTASAKPDPRAGHDKPRLFVSLALAAPVVAISMIPALHFPGWAWRWRPGSRR